MLKGGYQILDFKDRNLVNATTSKYDGIYDIIDVTRKAVLLSGLKIDDIEQRDITANPVLQGTSYVFNIKALDGTNYTLTVTDTDNVTLNTVE